MSFQFSSSRFSRPQTSFQFSSAANPAGTFTSVVNNRNLGDLIFNPNPGKIIFDPNRPIFNPPGTISNPPNPQPGPSQPDNSIPTNVPSQLLALLAAIPIATDGRVITSEYHNTLRAAILALAGQLGVGLITPTVIETLIPIFLPNGDAASWQIKDGAATKPAGSEAIGWLPLAIPDGSRLQSLVVFGTRNGTPARFEVRIVRQPVALDATSGGATITPLMAVDLKNSNPPFRAETTNFLVSGLGTTATAAASEDYKTIDNATYKYLLFAEISNDANVTAQVNAVQLIYQPGLAG